jgi:8-oxo-dGTP pyrophosphatase MutT (NUDIX family)
MLSILPGSRRRLAFVRELPEEMVLPEAVVLRRLREPDVEPRPAATVMLARDGAAGVELFLLRRVTGMAFAGGMTVFPGGGVDQRDADSSVAWTGPPPHWWAERFDCDAGLARALVCAAVREMFEEAGVLLAGPDPDTVVADTSAYARARQALVDRELSLAEFLTANGLVLRADLLRPWSNWLTPVGEARRYDTAFFLAELPAGQRADGVTTEADLSGWRRPADTLADWRAKRAGLMVPTWMSLSEVADYGTVAELMAAQRPPIEKIMPKLVKEDSVYRIVLPDDPRYPMEA